MKGTSRDGLLAELKHRVYPIQTRPINVCLIKSITDKFVIFYEFETEDEIEDNQTSKYARIRRISKKTLGSDVFKLIKRSQIFFIDSDTKEIFIGALKGPFSIGENVRSKKSRMQKIRKIFKALYNNPDIYISEIRGNIKQILDSQHNVYREIQEITSILDNFEKEGIIDLSWDIANNINLRIKYYDQDKDFKVTYIRNLEELEARRVRIENKGKKIYLKPKEISQVHKLFF